MLSLPDADFFHDSGVEGSFDDHLHELDLRRHEPESRAGPLDCLLVLCLVELHHPFVFNELQRLVDLDGRLIP